MKTRLTLLVLFIASSQWYSVSAQQQLTVRRNDTTTQFLMVEPIGTSFGAFYGETAGRKNTGSYNTLIGFGAGQENREGEGNTFVGEIAGQSNKSGNNNSYLGRGSGRLSRGSDNIYLGNEAGALNTLGSNNTFIGRSAGVASTGSNNVFLGFQAGSGETGNQKLYIENSAADNANALIYGEFDNNYLKVNGTFEVKHGGYGFRHSDAITSIGTYVDGGIGWFGTFTNDPIWFFTNDSSDPAMVIEEGTGNIAIGTTDYATGYKLSVKGKIATEEVLVDLSGAWPDYVFHKDYKLPSLKDVKASIHDYGHLPGVPSAAAVKEDGIMLGEMNKVLLEKIEQLTLYIIDQEERIKVLEAKVSGQQ